MRLEGIFSPDFRNGLPVCSRMAKAAPLKNFPKFLIRWIECFAMKKIKYCLLFGILIYAELVSADNASLSKSIIGHYVENREQVPVWNENVCGAFKHYLDSFPPKDSYRGCGLKPSEIVKDITFPEWEKIGILENSKIVKEMDLYIARNNYTDGDVKTDWKESIKKALADDPGYSLYFSKIDINDDGLPELVYRKDYMVSSCPIANRSNSPPSPRMVAFNEAGTVNKRISNFLGVISHYIFFYQGKTYRTLWGGTPNHNGITVMGWNGTECYFDYVMD